MILCGADFTIDKNLLYIGVKLSQRKLDRRIFPTLTGTDNDIIRANDPILKLMELLHPGYNQGWLASGLLKHLSQGKH